MRNPKIGTTPLAADEGTPAPQSLDPAVARQIATLRSHVRESFGQAVMAMMGLPRYRHQTLADLQHLVLEPLIRDRVAIATPAGAAEDPLRDIAGLAIWASVSEEVDARIREQIKAGTWPVRLKAEDWTSGSINWLLDVIAPDRAATARVIARFGQVLEGGDLRLHPQVAGLVEKGVLEGLGARVMGARDGATDPGPAGLQG